MMGIIKAFLFRIWPLLLLALVLWVIYWSITKKKEGSDEEILPPWQTKLWLWTFSIATFLMLLSVILMVMEFEENTDKQYVPAYMEDGKIEPGYMMPDDSN